MEPPPSSDDSIGPGTETYHHGRHPFLGVLAAFALVAGVIWAWRRGRPSRVAIEGNSMIPTLAPGEWALTIVPRRYERGDVVVVERPDRPGHRLVKRLTGLPGDPAPDGTRILGPDELWVEGDLAAASTDSRGFGSVRSGDVKAKVILVYWPRDRRRLVR